MAANTQRNSTNVNNIPTITVVDSSEFVKNDKLFRRSCCGCVPEIVGVFAILSLSFFYGIFMAAFSFVLAGHDDVLLGKVISIISGCLNAFSAIVSAMSISAIKKEKVTTMHRLSIAFCTITALMLISNIITFIIINFFHKDELIQSCVDDLVREGETDPDQAKIDCSHNYLVNNFSRILFRMISIYFAYVVFRFANRMKKGGLPFIAPLTDGQRTPTYFVYSAQPPTSTNWVPPPTYTVKPTHPLPEGFNPEGFNPEGFNPDDFDPDSKQIPN